MLNEDNFSRCFKKVNEYIHFMTSNDCFDMDGGDIISLRKYLAKEYPLTIVDTVSANNRTTEEFLGISNAIVVVLNQDKKRIDDLTRFNKLYEHKDKVVFVVNRFIEAFNNRKMQYTDSDIEKDIRGLGFSDNKVFKLDFDIDIINDCNDLSILNYVLSSKETSYLNQLKELSSFLLNQYGKYNIKDSENKKKRGFFNGRINFLSF